MNNLVSEHIHIKATLAVLVIDDFTDKILQHSGIKVSANGSYKPIRKSDGYYIFTNIMDDKIQLKIEASYYNDETITIYKSKLNNMAPLVKVRIKPNKAYGIPEGTTCLEGEAEPCSSIRLVWPQSNQFKKLLYDYKRDNKDDNKKSEYLHIFNPEGADLDGLEFYIADKDSTYSEIFLVAETVDKEENKYRLETVLQHDYKKMGTKLYQVYHTKADEAGRYFLPIKEIKKGNLSCNCMIMCKDLKKQEIVIEAGKINKYNLLE